VGQKKKFNFSTDSRSFLSQLQVHLQLGTNPIVTTLASGENGNLGLARVLEHFSLGCKFNCNWPTNPVATTLASVEKNGKKWFSMDSRAFLSQLQVHL
jgi:hypothetical protein